MRCVDFSKVPDGCKEILESIVNDSESVILGNNIQFLYFSFNDFKILYENGFLNKSSRHNYSPSVEEIYNYFSNKDKDVHLEGRLYLDGSDFGVSLDFDTILVYDPDYSDINFIVKKRPDEFHINEVTKIMRGWWD